MRDDKQDKQLAKLEEAQRRTEEHLRQQHKRVNERFERARQRILERQGDPSVNQQRIIDAALGLLDEDGLNSLSLRKLAGELNLQAPALYWYFRSKESLIDHMAEAILLAEFKNLKPRKADEPWQDWLVSIMKRLRKAMHTHRDGARIVAGAHLFPAVTLMKLFEVSTDSLTSAGVEIQKAGLIIMTATHFVFGTVIEEQSSPTLAEMKSLDLNSLMADYPLMKKHVERSITEIEDGYDEFEDALRLIIGHPS